VKVATYNVNGIRSRLPNLLEWLERERPDVVCLQELKAQDSAFPVDELRTAGYESIWKGQRSWNGVAILAREHTPVELRRELPGDPADEQSRYIEAAVNGLVVACLYLPNGNPQPGPKFDYKLAWFERLIRHAATLVDLDAPVVMAGDYNVVPTDFDIYNPRSWLKDALLQPQTRECYRRLLDQGWTDALRVTHPDEKNLHLLGLFPQALGAQCRPEDRSSPAQSRDRRRPGRGRCRFLGARAATRQRPRPDLGAAGPGQDQGLRRADARRTQVAPRHGGCHPS